MNEAYMKQRIHDRVCAAHICIQNSTFAAGYGYDYQYAERTITGAAPSLTQRNITDAAHHAAAAYKSQHICMYAE